MSWFRKKKTINDGGFFDKRDEFINMMPAIIPTYLVFYRDGKAEYSPIFGWMFEKIHVGGKTFPSFIPIYQEQYSRWTLTIKPYPPDEVLGIVIGNENKDWSEEIKDYEERELAKINSPDDIIRHRIW